MADMRELFKKKIIPITFERTIGLFGATTIGVGALMGAGIYVLIGLGANVAGPSIFISYAVCGVLAFLTTLLYAELARLAPATGGGYAYAYNCLGKPGWFCNRMVSGIREHFACGLYAIGFAEYFASILKYDISGFGIKIIALLLVLASTLINTRGTKSSEKVQKILTWGNIIILVVLALFSLRYLEVNNLKPMFPQGISGTGLLLLLFMFRFSVIN